MRIPKSTFDFHYHHITSVPSDPKLSEFLNTYSFLHLRIPTRNSTETLSVNPPRLLHFQRRVFRHFQLFRSADICKESVAYFSLDVFFSFIFHAYSILYHNKAPKRFFYHVRISHIQTLMLHPFYNTKSQQSLGKISMLVLHR